MPRLAFSGSATLKATVEQNVTLTKRAGEEPLEPAEIICGLIFFFFTVEKHFFFPFRIVNISSINIRKTFKWYKQDDLYKEKRQFNICNKV